MSHLSNRLAITVFKEAAAPLLLSCRKTNAVNVCKGIQSSYSWNALCGIIKLHERLSAYNEHVKETGHRYS